MIARAKEHDQVEGLIPHLVDKEVSIVQYTDDTIIFTEHNLEKALDMKLIFLIFSSSSTSTGVNFFIGFEQARDNEKQYQNVLDANQMYFCSNILVFLSTFVNLRTVNGSR
jgi:hypothetical protein